MKTKLALPGILFTSLLIAMPYAAAQDASVGATSETAAQAAVPTAQLAERYADLVGSAEAATDLVREMRVDPVTGETMGYGEINTTLALADAMVESGAAVDVATALDTLQQMRADGIGHGQVAQELGFDLGQVISAGVRADAAAVAAAGAAVNAAGSRATEAGSAAAARAGVETAASARLQSDVGRGVAADARVNARIDAGARGATSGRPAGIGLPALPQRVQMPTRPDLPLRPLLPGR